MTSTRNCSKCGQPRPLDSFQHHNGKPSGQCRQCKTEAMKVRRVKQGIPVRNASRIEYDKKFCTCCGQMKLLDDFSPSPRGLGGLSAWCKPCNADAARGRDKALARTRTNAYRKRHRARHLAMHRVRMFERKTKQRATSDGTVTDEFLKELYATEICRYCAQPTPEDDRTADHKVPLAKGGAHSAANMVMACWTCNSSKRDMAEAEFIQRITCSKPK